MRSFKEPPTETYGVYQTMKRSFEEICEGQDRWIPLGKFMNHWYGTHRDERERLIRDPLPEDYPPAFHRWAVFCAAAVEWFSHTYEVPCPAWVDDPRYTLDEPWFFERGLPREQLRQETPAEFARRNVFCGPEIFANKWEFVADLWVRYGEKLAAKVGKPSDEIVPYIEAARKKRHLAEQKERQENLARRRTSSENRRHVP